MNSYFKILRPINLFIIAITQYAIYFCLLNPLFKKISILPSLDGILIHLFVLTTLIITGSGFVINDLYDYDADIINKPDKTYIDTSAMSFESGVRYYRFLIILGGIIALYIGIRVDRIPLVLIYPTCVMLLYLYSKYLKKLPLIGNLLVALFSAFVPGIIFIAEWQGIYTLESDYANDGLFINYIFYSYLSFSFLISFFREIIKDIEDIEGDGQQDYVTFPILGGVQQAKKYALATLILLLGSYYFWIKLFINHAITATYTILFSLFIIMPTTYLYLQTRKAFAKSDFTKISKLTKYVMLVAVLIFISLTISYT